jgi:hypothetical protein
MNLTNAISGKHVEGIPCLGHTHINPRKARVPGREAFLGSETCANCRGPKLSQTDGEKSGRDPEPKEFILYLDHPSIPPSIHPYIYGAPQNGKDSNGLKVPPITCEEQRHIDEAPKRVSQAAQASLQISGVYRIYRS